MLPRPNVFQFVVLAIGLIGIAPAYAEQQGVLELSSELIVLLDDPDALSTDLETNVDLAREMTALANNLLPQLAADDQQTKLRVLASTGRYAAALETLYDIRDTREVERGHSQRFFEFQYELFLQSKMRQVAEGTTFEMALRDVLAELLAGLSHEEAFLANHFAGYSVEQGEDYMANVFARVREAENFDVTLASFLVSEYQDHKVFARVVPVGRELLEQDNHQRYIIEDDVLIETPDGAHLSAIVVRDRAVTEPQPSALVFTIYASEEGDLGEALRAAAHGYIGVLAFARGKRNSPDNIAPYETEARDVNAVIDWISRQPWSDGRVGMYGGSYNGFAQWASTKYLHPALRTIVPYVAAIPGLGLPMENNIFLNANYGWAFYVTNNRTLDTETYFQRDRWNALNTNWFQSGRAYREIDAVDGQPNPWLQRWLEHPAYDEYWQSMVPFREDYAQIDIPVLSITGYYDDGQVSALHYYNEHYAYNENAEHYLVIGPYDHWSAQGRPHGNLRGYEIDPVSHIDVPELTFDWLDHVLKNAARPDIVQDRVNFQLMGDNTWQHAGSLAEMNARTVRFYLGAGSDGDAVSVLSRERAAETASRIQQIDLADRESEHNDYYPWPIIRDTLEDPTGLVFVSEAFEQDMVVSGQFSGQLEIQINKQDVDLGVVLYEMLPDGRLFHLSYYLGRASYAGDMTARRLLEPGVVERVPLEHTRMTGKRMRAGSRLVVVVDVNKNAFAQVNYGTGADVSDETIADAAEPLEIHWLNSSYLDIPLRPASELLSQ
jgi:putative CocE/NonD family hydrolase